MENLNVMRKAILVNDKEKPGKVKECLNHLRIYKLLRDWWESAEIVLSVSFISEFKTFV